ncbi:MAG: SUMF1/EgtB/PvdO family nonheme iron enzyme, partial [Waterburya sp.]
MAKNWAIIIGINEYSYLDELNFAKTDAEAMHLWLQQSGGFDPQGLFLFTDDSQPIQTNPPITTQPTFGHLDTFFDVQFDRKLLTSADNLWFFFSGHGNRGTGGDYLMLSDSNPRRLEQTALSVSYITERLRNWGAGNVVMFIDACRNVENQAKGGTITTQDYQGMIAFYSCRDKEKSKEVKSIKRGAFTHILLEALESTKRQNRCLTVAELEEYLMREVPKLSPNQHPLARVEPTYKSNFILFGEAREKNIESLYNLALKKAFVENKKEEATELLLHANMAAKGCNSDILNALVRISSSSSTINSSKQPENKEVTREKGQAQSFTEELGNGINLEMIAISGGTFIMGSPEGEGYDDEKPQHEVTVQPFFMGKYPITQAQWKAIADREDLKVEHDLDPNPAYFKDRDDSARRPVEQVSWYDAIEFCARLSKLSVREYRLPSEAEWEYACRAGTSTPFHFGETITTDLANYDGNYTYANAPKGEYRQQTTPVG